MHNNSYEILKTKSLIGKDLHQSKKDYSMVGNLDVLMLAPKIKYCIVIDENGKLSQKTTLRGFDQNMATLKFEDFPDFERD